MNRHDEQLSSQSVSEPRKRSWKAWLWHGPLLAAIAVAAWEFIDFKQLATTLLQARPGMLVVLFLLGTADRFFMAVKWFHLMRAIDIAVSYPTVLNSYYQAAFMVRLVPSTLSGDALRGYIVTRETGSWDRILGSMVVEKAVAILASVALATIGVSILWGSLNQEGATFLVFAVPAIGVLAALGFLLSLSKAFGTRVLRLVRWQRARRPVGKFLSAYGLFRKRAPTVFANLCLAFAEQTLQILILYLCALAIGVDVSAWLLVSVLTVSQFLRKFAIVLEGWALGEFVVVLTCALAGIDQTQALAFSLLGHVVGMVVSLPGAALMAMTRRRHGPTPQHTGIRPE